MTTSSSEATTPRNRSGTLLTLLVTFIAAACLVYRRVLDNDLTGALNGYSPTTLMGDFWFKPQFAANYYQRLCDSLQVDVSKTRQLLNWSPPLSVDEGLQLATARVKA